MRHVTAVLLLALALMACQPRQLLVPKVRILTHPEARDCDLVVADAEVISNGGIAGASYLVNRIAIEYGADSYVVSSFRDSNGYVRMTVGLYRCNAATKGVTPETQLVDALKRQGVQNKRQEHDAMSASTHRKAMEVECTV